MPNGLVLLRDGLVALRILLLYLRLATVVEQELCLVQILLLAGSQIKAGECHFSNLVARHHTSLSRVRTNLLAHHVSIAAGNVQELRASRSLPVSDGSFHHVAKVIQLVAQILLFHPARRTCPMVRVCGVLRACSIEVTIGLLRRSDDVDDRVDVVFQLLSTRLLVQQLLTTQKIRCSFDGFVGVGIVKRVAHPVHLKHLRGVFQVYGCVLKVFVAPFTLAL